MAGYARFRRARKSFGSRRGMRRSGGSRGSRYGYKKTKGRGKLRFATVGFSRNVEKKYFDKTYQSSVLEAPTGSSLFITAKNNGVTYISNTWGSYTFGTQIAGVAPLVNNDMFKGLATGTDARTRIGNKIRPQYLKGSFTFQAAVVDTTVSKSQGGEAFAEAAANPKLDYLRTTYRMAIVKDLQVNSTDAQITWPQVFDTNGTQAGVHSELNVDNMGRFIVLEDKVFTLDADNPQKTCPFMVSGSAIGPVRYNGPGGTALTDKGVAIVFAAFVYGYGTTVADIQLHGPVGNSRLCFTDD